MMCLREGTFTTIEKAQAIFDGLERDPSVRDWAEAYYIAGNLEPCVFWAVTPREPNTEIMPMESDLRTLMLVGSFDPETPPFMSEPYRERLVNSYRYELPFGHGQVLSACGLNLIGQFFADPTQAPDASCVAEMKMEWVLPE